MTVTIAEAGGTAMMSIQTHFADREPSLASRKPDKEPGELLPDNRIHESSRCRPLGAAAIYPVLASAGCLDLEWLRVDDKQGAALQGIAAAGACGGQPLPHRLGSSDQGVDLGQLASGERL
jgi:hypothetical protein